ncbi:MAG: hypothetical protein JWP25_8998 [Bradyrhizobium sp.]|nr:hypothetical protein [Bradyrhizobium sp.]
MAKITCEACGGEGRDLRGHPNDPHPKDYGPCLACGGTGQIDRSDDWPLSSFDPKDWVEAFCKIANGFGFKDAEGKPLDEGWMISWFANALMRGYDQRSSEIPPMDVRCERGCTLRKVNAALRGEKRPAATEDAGQ